MPRPFRCRRIEQLPVYRSFSPDDITASESIRMTVDEFEALRLLDDEGLTQEACASRMNIARTTVTAIYDSARKKVADALVNGKRLLITGGHCEFEPVEIYQEIISQHPELKDKTVSLATDEMVFLENPNTYQNPGNAVSLQEDIKRIAKENGFDVHVEFFFLQGYNLVFKESRSVRKTFYHKDFVLGDSNFKLIAAPLPYHAMIYKLFKGLPLEEIDYHFDYEGMDARFCEEFDIEQLQ